MKLFRKIFSKINHIMIVVLTNLFSVKGRVLMLHWVGDEPLQEDIEPYRISISEFKQLLSFLKKQRTINLFDWEKQNNFYALTFDDVPEIFYYNAFPLLKEFHIPFTIFVNVSLLGQKGYVNEQQLIIMSQCDLCTIGSHAINHCEFASLSKDKITTEFFYSKRILEALIGSRVTLFAYPYGSYYACGYRYKSLCLNEYDYAFGTVCCPITKPRILNKYFLPRINVDSHYIRSLQ